MQAEFLQTVLNKDLQGVCSWYGLTKHNPEKKPNRKIRVKWHLKWRIGCAGLKRAGLLISLVI